MPSVPQVPLRREAVDPTSLSVPARGGPSAAYMRGGASPVFRGWNPALRDASDEVKVSWDKAAARAFDLIHNSGWIAGAIDQAVANTVGTGLRLSLRPDAEALGMTEDEASAWAERVEGRFELWASNPTECDVEGKRTFGQLQAAAFRSWIPTGEIVAEFPWRMRPGRTYGSKVRLVAPHRLSRKCEGPRLEQGVRVDADGMPVSYVFNRKEGAFNREVELPARDSYGRTRVALVLDGLPGQMRGISPLTPVLQAARQFDQLSDSTLTAHLIKAAFAATITSSEPTEEVLRNLLTPSEQAQMASEGMSVFDTWAAAQEGWYKGTTVDVGIKGRFAHLFPGQKLEFQHADGSTVEYKDMAVFLLREFMRCLGLTNESGTGDYTGATYSSVRMATGEIFGITLYRRKNVVAPFCQPAFENWLEEDIDRGLTPFPGGLDGFLERRAAACRAEWKGSPKPQADDLKLAKAHEVWATLGVITDEMICNDLGVDVEDVYRQRARERSRREFHKLPERTALAADPVADKLLTEEDT